MEMRDEVVSVERAWVLRAFRTQMMAGGSPMYGAWVGPQTGNADPGHMGGTALSCGAVMLLRAGAVVAADRDEYWSRAVALLDYVDGARRETGRLDLVDCNPDSAPDTAFVAQMMASVVLLERRRPSGDPLVSTWCDRALEVLRDMAQPIATGGFHTPNHRWVIASALSMLVELMPDLAPTVQSSLTRYLGEGTDIDPDGLYPERSITIYDGVTNRSLLLIGLCGNWDESRAIVRTNLEASSYLIDSDGRADTSLSTRQDHGQRRVPLTLIDSLIAVGVLEKDPALLRRAAQLWAVRDGESSQDWLFWLLWSLEMYRPELPQISDLTSSQLSYWKAFPVHSVVRYRHHEFTATVSKRSSFLALQFGDVRVARVMFFQAVHGVGTFDPDAIEIGDHTVELSQSGYVRRRPAYEHPLGSPVPWSDLAEARQRRDLRRLGPLDVRARVLCDSDHIALRLTSTTDGWDGVLAQLTLDIPAGTQLKTADLGLHIQPGQQIFLTGSEARIVGETHELTLSGGAADHQTWSLRESPAPLTDCGQIVIPLRTPVNHQVRLRGNRRW